MNEQEDVRAVLTDEKEIKEAKALVKSVEFSMFYRRESVEQYKEYTKSYEKLLKFLESDNNTKHQEVWKPITQQIKQTIENNLTTIDQSKISNEREEDFFEELMKHVVILESGEVLFDYNYFEAVLKQARIYGNNVITHDQVLLMKLKDFIKDEKELYDWK